MRPQTLRSFQANLPLSTLPEARLNYPSGRAGSAESAPAQPQPETSEQTGQSSAAALRPGLQQEAGFEVNSMNFPKPQGGQTEPLTVPLSENEAEATGVRDIAEKGLEQLKEKLDPCNASNPMRRKANRCHETPSQTNSSTEKARFDTKGLNDLLRNSPAELQQIFQSTNHPPQIRTQAMLVYSQKIGLLSEATTRSLFKHPYTQRLGSSSPGNTAERSDFQRQLSAAFQPGQAMFERLSGTLGHFASEALNRTTQNMDNSRAAAGQAIARGYPTLGEVQTLLRTGDIEPLKMMSQAVKDAGYGQLDQLYQQYHQNPAMMFALTSADAAASSLVDIAIPTNLIDLAGKYSKFIELDSMKALSGTAKTSSHGTGSASSMVLEPANNSRLQALAERVIKHPSKNFEQAAFRLRWSYQQRVDNVVNQARSGQLPQGEARRKVQDLQAQFAQQFQALSQRNVANELLIGKFLLSSPVWTTWDLR